MTQPANATSFLHSSPQPCSHNLAASSSSDSSNRSEVPAPLSCSPTANDVRPLNGYARALTLWFSPISVAYSSPYYVHPEGTAMEALQNPFPETTMQRQVVNAAQAERIQLNLSEQFPLNIPLGRVGNHHNTHIHGAHMPSQGQIFDQEEEVEEVASEKWWHSTASGVVGGVFCVYAGQPFDTIKVRLQTQNPANKIYSNPLDCFKKTVSAEGFKSLYKGSSAALASVVLENAVLFTANSHAKNFIRSISNIDSNTDLTLGQEAMAGGMAGFFSSTAITPAEVIKCRMQIQATSSVGPVYKNPADALMQIVKKEGPTGLFKGLSSVWMRDIPFNFVFLGSYEAYCSLAGWQLGKERDELGAGELFFSGGMAGVTGWSVVFPMDAIKSKIQTSTLAKANVVDIVKHTLKTEGIRGFYQGWSAAVMRAFPANAALLLGVELSRKFFEDL